MAWYFHMKDLQCLEQAVMISQATGVDLKEIERWSKQEKKSKEFAGIKERLVSQNRSAKFSRHK